MWSDQIEIEAGEGNVTAFLAIPDDTHPRPLPGLVVLHEILGLNDDIRGIARRFAASGYASVAPDLYAGPGPRPLCIVRTLRSLARGEGPGFETIERTRRWLAGRPEVDAARIGVVGFCMGGGFALLFANGAPISAVATFYGEVPKRPSDLDGICPVLGGFGARDGVFAKAGRRLDEMLNELGVEHDVVVYPDVGHSYMNEHSRWVARLGPFTPMRASFDEQASEDSWRRMLAFFERWLAHSEGAN